MNQDPEKRSVAPEEAEIIFKGDSEGSTGGKLTITSGGETLAEGKLSPEGNFWATLHAMIMTVIRKNEPNDQS